MSEILFHYHKIEPATWVYLSSLLMIGLFFKFNRFWSVRNLDLILLILLAPGLVMVNEARQMASQPAAARRRDDCTLGGRSRRRSAQAVQTPTARLLGISPERLAYFGYLWLFAISGVWLVRLLLDPTMVRRPLLEPNLTSGGLIFIGVALFAFLMANVFTSQLTADDLSGAKGAQVLYMGLDTTGDKDQPEDYRQHGPGFYLLHLLPTIPTSPFIPPNVKQTDKAFEIVAKLMAIASHFAVVAGLVTIGYWHFENIRMGVGAAMLYLMLPYTAQMTGHVDHVLPAAFLLWAVVLYRRPALAGFFLGLAIAVFYYPLFLLPLWISFYWQRGLARFLSGGGVAIAIMILSLVFVSKDLESFWHKFQPMFALWIPKTEGLMGIWGLAVWLGSLVPPAGHRRLRRPRRRPGDLACSQKSRHAPFLLGRDDGRRAVLARLRRRRRHVYGLVPAAPLDDRLPPEPGRPRGPDRARRRLVHQTPRSPRPARPRGLAIGTLAYYAGTPALPTRRSNSCSKCKKKGLRRPITLWRPRIAFWSMLRAKSCHRVVWRLHYRAVSPRHAAYP